MNYTLDYNDSSKTLLCGKESVNGYNLCAEHALPFPEFRYKPFKVIRDNKSIYIGEMNEKEEENGKGVQSHSAGEYYCGEWKDGFVHGFGTNISNFDKDGKEEYTGYFHKGRYFGHGSLTVSGFKCEGKWIEGGCKNAVISVKDVEILYGSLTRSDFNPTTQRIDGEMVYGNDDRMKANLKPNLGTISVNYYDLEKAFKDMSKSIIRLYKALIVCVCVDDIVDIILSYISRHF